MAKKQRETVKAGELTTPLSSGDKVRILSQRPGPIEVEGAVIRYNEITEVTKAQADDLVESFKPYIRIL